MSLAAGKLAGKRVVVTGGARGIGRAIVERAAREGATVDFSFHRSEAAAAALVASLAAEGRDVAAHACDVRVATDLEAWLARVEAGRGGVDGLVNNAGIALERLLLATSDDELHELFAVDLLAPIIASRAVLRGMVRRRGGVIVQVGSVAAQRPARGQSIYAAAKGALEAFTRALAVEVAPRGVRALCIAPGPVRTEMLATALALDEVAVRSHAPDGAIAEPDDVARLVVFALSDAAAGLTGRTLGADGVVPGYPAA